MPTIYLASASPRRRELLGQLKVAHEVLRVCVDETRLPEESAADMVRRLAVAKARAGAACRPMRHSLVLAADTAVALGAAEAGKKAGEAGGDRPGDGSPEELFGKPADAADARRMLGRLSGRTHDVWTAVAVTDGQDERVDLSRSRVTFRALDPGEIAAYVRTGEPADKAGAYAIQGLAAQFISGLQGSYSGVMGLPLYETARLLAAFGHSILSGEDGAGHATAEIGTRR